MKSIISFLKTQSHAENIDGQGPTDAKMGTRFFTTIITILKIVVLAVFVTSCVKPDVLESTSSFSSLLRTIVISDDVLRVQSDQQDKVISDIKIYDQTPTLVLHDPGCDSLECQVEESHVATLSDGQYLIKLTLVNPKTSATAEQIDTLIIDRP